jgi:uncharacterized protein (TIGR00730 family)
VGGGPLSEGSPGRAICVYCASADGIPTRYLDLARDVGAGVAARGWELVSGGSRLSMMGAVASAAREGGARTTGVMPRSMVAREWADDDSDELLVVETMRERKAVMEERADAFLTLPGGIGTCEEFFEIWTSGTLGLHRKPVVVLDPDGHYAGLLDWLRDLGARCFLHGPALARFTVVADVDSALDACARSVTGR